MGNPENSASFNPDRFLKAEELNPGHFYAAYIFDQAETREEDVRIVLEQAHNLGYPVRYWWLSNAVDLAGFPDRLIVCVHDASRSDDAGMDLYNALTDQQARWDDLEAAALDEYRIYGRPTTDKGSIRLPNGQQLFPPKE
jgi:hypothetical protein